MLSIYEITEWINDLICGTLKGAQVYGIARHALKDGVLVPVVGEKVVTIDDTYPAIAYHRHESIRSQEMRGTGYGDVESYLKTTHEMSLILFFNEKLCGYGADELYAYIQLQVTGVLKKEGQSDRIRVSVNSAILDDGQVWAQEYGSADFRLHVYQRLIKIGYSVDITLRQNCISIPNCKN